MATKLKSSIGHIQEVTLSGGPWDNLTLAVRPRDRHKNDASLPIKVGRHYGRYNLSSGKWEAL